MKYLGREPRDALIKPSPPTADAKLLPMMCKKIPVLSKIFQDQSSSPRSLPAPFRKPFCYFQERPYSYKLLCRDLV